MHLRVRQTLPREEFLEPYVEVSDFEAAVEVEAIFGKFHHLVKRDTAHLWPIDAPQSERACLGEMMIGLEGQLKGKEVNLHAPERARVLALADGRYVDPFEGIFQLPQLRSESTRLNSSHFLLSRMPSSA